MSLGRLLIFAGVALIAGGVTVILLERAHLPLGRLPGDLLWRGKNTTIYFPIVTCVLLSLIGTLILWLVNRRYERSSSDKNRATHFVRRRAAGTIQHDCST